VRELPSGTVTFLFTDIEGSTRLLRELGEGYAGVLAEHRRVLRDAFVRHGGVEVDTQGDAFFVAFARASDALAAARESQEGLRGGRVRVRMGVHTGEPLVTEDGYVGIDVHRAARIAAVGYGGQVLVSQATFQLVGADGLRDLGEHRLKDLTAPERIFQLGEADFPPLKSLNTTNLPVASSALVGRDRELGEITSLLRDSARVVTLTGPGGTGKTRLALQAAAELVDEFRGGVFFVPLAGVQEPDLVATTIASTIGVHDFTELAERQSLLLLDNFEHLLDAAPTVTELARSGRQLKLMTTSRAPLRVEGEQEYPVDPLPDGDAVTLLAERARAVRPGFTPDEATKEICRRLDGLPLALELAAPRLRSLDAAALLERLERRLPVLTAGRRDAPERQRTLRATIEWSYDLLEEDLQRVFARLGVFATFTLDAAERVARATYDDVDALVEASLLKPLLEDRFLMLETVREFALERLAENDEEEETRERHLEHLIDVARAAKLHTEDTGPMRHELVNPERNNIRAALDWAVATGRQREGLSLAIALENNWVTTDPAEGAHWIGALLELGTPGDEQLMMALRCLGNSATVQGSPEGLALYEQSLAIARKLGAPDQTASLLHRVAVWHLRDGRSEEALALLEEGEEFNRRAPLERVTASFLLARGDIERKAGNLEAALLYYEESLAAARRSGFTWWEKNVLMVMGYVLYELGRTDDALARAHDALSVADTMADRPGVADAILLVARGHALRGDPWTAGRMLGVVEGEDARAPIPGWASSVGVLVTPLLQFEGTDFDGGRESGRGELMSDVVDEVLRSVD
jgi:predicted ATPase